MYRIFYLGLNLDGTVRQFQTIDGNDQEVVQSMAVDQKGGIWLGGFSDSDSLIIGSTNIARIR